MIVVRDLIDELLRSIQAFENPLTTAASFNPSHFALPWAAVQSVLTLTTEDGQLLEAFAEGLAFIGRLLKYSYLESSQKATQTAATGQELGQELEQAL
jgi:hypothetical protein